MPCPVFSHTRTNTHTPAPHRVVAKLELPAKHVDSICALLEKSLNAQVSPFLDLLRE